MVLGLRSRGTQAEKQERRAIAKAELEYQQRRFREAIATLTAANREHRSTVLEQRLVAYRHQAFLAMDHPAGLSSWPPDSPDLFASQTGMIEVPKDQLTADALRAGIQRHGALIVRGLFNTADVAHLRDDIDKAFAAREAALQGAPVSETEPWYVPLDPVHDQQFQEMPRSWVRESGGVHAVDSPRTLFNLIEMIEGSGVVEVLTAYLGERPSLSAVKTTLRIVPPHLNAENGWHQDGAFLGDNIRTVNLWIALSHCGVDAPALDLVPRRLPAVVATGTHGAAFDWSVGRGMVDECLGEGGVPARPVFAPGDAIMFDEVSLHRTAISPGMTKDRYAIEAWFFAPSHYPMKQIPILF
jgi:hypothetical protein